MKKKIAVFLTSILFGLTGIFVPIFSNTKAQARTSSDTTSFVSVGELWDKTNKKFNSATVSTLFDYLTGTYNADYSQVETLVESGDYTAADIRTTAVTNLLGSTLKESGKDVIVTLGGLQWEVVYLSTDVYGDPIVTLWLDNNIQSAWTGRSQTEGEYYGFYQGGLYSDYSANWVMGGYDLYPSNMYGTSYVRTVTLNNGGYYAKNNTTLSDYFTPSSTSVFAMFTVDSFGLTQYLTTPSEVPYQWSLQGCQYGGNHQPNENAKDGFVEDELWFSINNDYTDNAGYYNWANDYIWLPALSECNISYGIWKISSSQGANDITEGKVADNQMGSNQTAGESFSKMWSRSAAPNTDQNTYSIFASGNNYEGRAVSDNLAVRPALHLNLNEVIESFEQSDNTTVYLNPETGSDDNNGSAPFTAVKTLDKAEELVANNGEIVVMNTITLLTDKILGENKTYTLKRYYGDSTKNFKGDMLLAGKFVSNGSADNIFVNLTLRNVTLDGNRYANGESPGGNFGTRAASIINGENCHIKFEKTCLVKDHHSSDHARAVAYLQNASDVTINGAEFTNCSNWEKGTLIKSTTASEIIINDGRFVKNKSTTGAVIVDASSATVIVNDGIFGEWIDLNEDGVVDNNENYGNKSEGNIGLFYVKNLTINGGSFAYNQANNSDLSAMFRATNIVINGGKFSNNTLNIGSGNEDVITVSLLKANKLEINDGIFENTTSLRGGSVVGMMANGVAIIKNATFKNNTALVGGAIYINKNVTAVIENCEFIGNSATGTYETTKLDGSATTASGGGAVYGIGCILTVKNCLFKENTTTKLGGAITVYDAKETTKVFSSEFIKNTAVEGAGACKAQARGTFFVYDSTFKGNESFSHGGAIYLTNAVNCYFEENKSFGHGGAAYYSPVSYSTFIKNEAGVNGGGAHAAQTVDHCFFEGNKAVQKGGAVSGEVSITNCDFILNYSQASGGAAYISDSSIRNCTFENNFANTNGGAISSENDIVITGIELKNNVAKEKGAGIYFTGAGTITLGGKDYNAYHFIFNNFIGESIESFSVDSNGDLIGANESNLYIDTTTFTPIILKVNFAEGSKVGLTSGLLDEELLIAKLDGEDAVLSDYTIDAFVYDNNTNYETYSKAIYDGTTKTGVGLYIKDITAGSGQISYTADDTLAEYDGTPHTINVKVNNVENYEIWYSTSENGVYSKTPITVTEPGDSKEVWFYITADGYSDTAKECRVVTVDKLELFINRSDFLFSFYLGQRIIKTQDVSYFVKGTVYDINGNAVAYKATSAVNVNITNNNNTSIALYFEPINTGKYKTLENVSIPAEVRYENLYMKNSFYYIDEALTDAWKVPVADFSASELIPYIVDGGTLYMLETANIVDSITLTTDKTLYISRMSGYANNEMLNVTTGKLTIGSLDMAGTIILEGKDLNSIKPIVAVQAGGELTIKGNVVIQNAKNTYSYGGAILNLGNLTIDGLTIKNCTSYLGGGGIYSTKTLTANNLTIDGCQGATGGAIWVRGTATISNSLITKNTAAKLGSATNAFGAGVYVTESSTIVTISNTTISGNTNTHENNDSYGGGLVAETNATVYTNNVYIVGNTANRGAGIYVKGAKVIATKTFVNENFVKDRGIIYLTETDTLLELVSGSIDSNTASKTVSAVYLGSFAKFVFGTDDSYLSTINNNKLISSSSNRATAVYLAGSAIFEMYSGVIGSHYETDATEATIYVRSKSQIKLYGGELSKNQKISKTPIFTEDDCAIYLSGNFKYDGKYTVESPNDISRAVIYLMDNLANLDSLTLTLTETVNTLNQPFVMADSTVFNPTWEEWNEIFAKVNIQNIPAGYTATKDFIYDSANGIYTIYLNSEHVSSGKFYFDPSKGASANSNSGLTAAQAVGTWDKVLELTKPGDTVYLVKTWEITASTTIYGGERKLVRYYQDNSNNLKTHMIEVKEDNIVLTINDLVIDGNKTKNGTASALADYFATEGSVIFSLNFNVTINLTSVEVINNYRNNAGGGGIRIQFSALNKEATLNLSNCKVNDNYVVNDAASNYVGAGIFIYTNVDNDNNKLNINLQDTEICRNYVRSKVGNSADNITRANGAGIAIRSDKVNNGAGNWKINIVGCKVNENQYASKDYKYYNGSAIYIGTLADTTDNSNDVNLKLNILNTEITNNKGNMGVDPAAAVPEECCNAVAINFLGGKVDMLVKNSRIGDNAETGSNIFVKVRNNSKITFENCDLSSSYRSHVGNYFNVGNSADIEIKDCVIDSPSTYINYINSPRNVLIENCEILSGAHAIHTTGATGTVKVINTKIVVWAYGLRLDNQKTIVKNVTINGPSHGVYLTETSNLEVTLENVKMTNIDSVAINAVDFSIDRKLVLNNVEGYNCNRVMIYRCSNYASRSMIVANNVKFSLITTGQPENFTEDITNLSIDDTEVALNLTNVNFMGENVTISDCGSIGIYVGGVSILTGITMYNMSHGIVWKNVPTSTAATLNGSSITNCKIYNCGATAVTIPKGVGKLTISDCEFYNNQYVFRFIKTSNTRADKVTIQNCILDNNRYGIDLFWNGLSIGSTDYGVNTYDFKNLEITNTHRTAIIVRLNAYDGGTDTPTTADFNFTNCLITGSIYGIYVEYYKGNTNNIDYDINIDSATEISGNTYGVYAVAQSETAKRFVLNGGKVINNEIGIASNTTGRRLDIAGTAVVKDNTVADVMTKFLYLYDDVVIGSTIVTGEGTIYADSSLTKTDKIKLLIQGSFASGKLLVQGTGSWTASTWNSDKGANRFICDSATLTIDTTAFTIKVNALKDTNPTGRYYFDPSNKTGKASDTNNGTTFNTPLKTWSTVLSKTSAGDVIYLLSTWEISGNIDAGNRVLTLYVDTANNTLYTSKFVTYLIKISGSSTKVSNLIFDGNRTKNGTVGVFVRPGPIPAQTNEGLVCAMPVVGLTAGSSVTLENSEFKNFALQNDLIYATGSTFTVKNCTFKDINNTQVKTAYFTIRGRDSSTLSVQDSTFENVWSGIITQVSSKSTIENCDFKYIYYTAICVGADLNNSSKIVQVKNCNILGYPNESEQEYCIFVGNNSNINMTDCSINGGYSAIQFVGKNNNSTVQNTTLSNIASDTISILGTQNDITFSNVDFYYDGSRCISLNATTDTVIYLENCDFNYCDVGFYIYDKTMSGVEIDLYNCTMDYCQYGVCYTTTNTYNREISWSFENSKFTNCSTAVFYNKKAAQNLIGSKLEIENCKFINNADNLMVGSGFSVTIKGKETEFNTGRYGIDLYRYRGVYLTIEDGLFTNLSVAIIASYSANYDLRVNIKGGLFTNNRRVIYVSENSNIATLSQFHFSGGVFDSTNGMDYFNGTTGTASTNGTGAAIYTNQAYAYFSKDVVIECGIYGVPLALGKLPYLIVEDDLNPGAYVKVLPPATYFTADKVYVSAPERFVGMEQIYIEGWETTIMEHTSNTEEDARFVIKTVRRENISSPVSKNVLFFDPANSTSIASDGNVGYYYGAPLLTLEGVLSRDYLNATVYIISTWTITADCVIDGKGLTLTRYYESGSKDFKEAFIKTEGNINVVIKNLNFDGNGQSVVTEGSQAVYVYNETVKNNVVELNNCKIFNFNTSIAPIYVERSILEMNNCVVDGNYNSNNGTIYLKAGFISENTIFSNNETAGNGSAIYIDNGSTVRNVSIYDCEFINNYSTGDSTIFGTTSHKTSLFISNTKFIGNSIKNFGVISVNCKYVEVENCLFDRNASRNKRISANYASAISTYSKTSITNCVFKNGGQSGSTIKYIYTDAVAHSNGGDEFVVENCLFENNNTVQGEIYVNDAYAYADKLLKVNIENCDFINCTSTGTSSVICLNIQQEKGGIYNIENCNIENVISQGDSLICIYMLVGEDALTIKDIEINNCEIAKYAIMIDDNCRSNADIEVTNVNFTNNNNSGNSTDQNLFKLNVSSPITIANVIIDNNVVGGTMITMSGNNTAELIVDNLIVKNNIFSRAESANTNISAMIIESSNQKTIEMTNSIFDNNKNYSNQVASMVKFTSIKTTIEINSVVFDNNSINGAMLLVYDSRNATTTVTNLEMINNIGYHSEAVSAGMFRAEYSGDVEISNSIFENNTTNYAGGGVFGLNTNLVIINTKFIGNKALRDDITVPNDYYQTGTSFSVTVPASAYRGGGAISLTGGSLIADNIEVINNSSVSIGGGITLFAPFTITNSVISGNTALVGGGLFTTMDGTIDGVVFENNKAGRFGGAINFGAKTIINNSRFIGNSSLYDGGALYGNHNNSDLIIENIIFQNNQALRSGGAIYFGNSVGVLSINGTDFIGNSAEEEGSAIFTRVNLNLTGNTFSGNYIYGQSLVYVANVTVSVLDGVIISGNYGEGNNASLFKFASSIAQPTVSIKNSLIYGNTTNGQATIVVENGIFMTIDRTNVYTNVNLAANGTGGLINVKSGTLLLQNSYIKNNFAANGAAVYIGSGSKATITNTLFTGHNGYNGMGQNGVIYIEDAAQVTITDSEIINNYSTASNGIIYNAGILNLSETAVTGNTVKNGTVYNAETGILSLQDITITGNRAHQGGAVYNQGVVNLTNSNLTNNETYNLTEAETVYGKGGAIFNDEGGMFTISSGLIENNKSAYGGAIYNKGDFSLNGGEILSNAISHSGGGVYNDTNGNFIMNNGSINLNTAQVGATSASGFGVANAGRFSMYSGEINENGVEIGGGSYTQTKGGAVYGMIGSYNIITGGDLIDNTAESGAAIYIDSTAVATIKSVNIINQLRWMTTKSFGKAIYGNGATVTMSFVTIKGSGSYSSNNYGTIYALSSTVKIQNCEIVDNLDNIGVASFIGGSLDMYNTVFEGNTASYDSNSYGILLLENLNSFVLDYCEFTDNSSNNEAGAIKIKLSDSKLNGKIVSCLFDGNEAGTNGGAISIDSTSTENTDSYLQIDNCEFVKNEAAENGGAIYVGGGNGIMVEIKDTTFGGWVDKNSDTIVDSNETYGNEAKNGGAIHFADNSTAIGIIFKGDVNISYNKASEVGAGIFYTYSHDGNDEIYHYNLRFDTGCYAVVKNNTLTGGYESNIYMKNSADLAIIITGLDESSEIGLSFEDASGNNLNAGDVIVKGFSSDAIISSSDVKAFFYDSGVFNFKLDTANNQIVLCEATAGTLTVIAGDLVYTVDGAYKSVTADDLLVLGSTDYSVTFASEENGVYSENSPKFISKGTYTVWYKVVDNTNSAEVKGSIIIKIIGRILVVTEAPEISINKGETLSQATFRRGLVQCDGSAVSGTWEFEDGTATPTGINTKYKLIFKPSNDLIYENTAYIYTTVNMTFYKVYYFNDGTNVGFFNNRPGGSYEALTAPTSTSFTGITSLAEMVSCMQDGGQIYFAGTYIVGQNGTIEENVVTDKTIYLGKYGLWETGNMIVLPDEATKLKLTFGGTGKIIIGGTIGYSSRSIRKPVFENYGILEFNEIVEISGFYNVVGGCAVADNYGTMYLNGCKIFSNRSSRTTSGVTNYAGAINNYGNIVINGGEYIGNRSSSANTTNGMGGFVYNEGTIIVNGGIFKRNVANKGGFVYSNGGQVTINGGDIIGNHAYSYGGAIYATNGAQIDLNGGNLMLNGVPNVAAGPAIYNDNANIFINGTDMRFNVVSSIGLEEEISKENEGNNNLVLAILVSLTGCLLVACLILFILQKKVNPFKIKARK